MPRCAEGMVLVSAMHTHRGGLGQRRRAGLRRTRWSGRQGGAAELEGAANGRGPRAAPDRVTTAIHRGGEDNGART